VRQVDVGLYHTCVITEAHTLRCWGSNEFGQLGIGRAGSFGATPETYFVVVVVVVAVCWIMLTFVFVCVEFRLDWVILI
jgi:alpha-tubulin suppressor-like RCC1 family protein